MTDPTAVGLCFTCRWARPAGNRRGSVFFRCGRAQADPGFPRYPTLPVRVCPGHEVMMLFVVLLHYAKPQADVDAVRAEHLRYLEAAAARGRVLAWARRDPPAGGVLVCAAEDRAALEGWVAGDPYVRTAVARPEIVAFDPRNVRRALRTDPYFE